MSIKFYTYPKNFYTSPKNFIPPKNKFLATPLFSIAGACKQNANDMFHASNWVVYFWGGNEEHLRFVGKFRKCGLNLEKVNTVLNYLGINIWEFVRLFLEGFRW